MQFDCLLGYAMNQHWDMPADQVGHCRPCPAIGDVRDVCPGQKFEPLADQMIDRTHARRTVVDFPWISLSESNEVVKSCERLCGVNRDAIGVRAEYRDRHKILDWIVKGMT